MTYGSISNGKLAPRLEPFARMLEAVLRQPEELTYVRHDGFTLLSEVLSAELVRPLVEGLAPGTAAALKAEAGMPSNAMSVVNDVVKGAQLADGSPRFELWEEEDASDGWIRVLSQPVVAKTDEASKDWYDKGTEAEDWQPAAQKQTEGQQDEADPAAFGNGPSPLLRRCLDETAHSNGTRFDDKDAPPACADTTGARDSGTATSTGQSPVAAPTQAPEARSRGSCKISSSLPSSAPAHAPDPSVVGPARALASLPGWIARQAGGPDSLQGFGGRSAGLSRARPTGPCAEDPWSSSAGPWGGCSAWGSTARQPDEAAARDVASAPARTVEQPQVPVYCMSPSRPTDWLNSNSGGGTVTNGRGNKIASFHGSPAVKEEFLSPVSPSSPGGELQAVLEKRRKAIDAACESQEAETPSRNGYPPAQAAAPAQISAGPGRPSAAEHAVAGGTAWERPPSRPPPQRALEHMRGRLKAFYKEKGFGFIGVDDIDTDIFVHATSFAEATPVNWQGGVDLEVEFDLDTSRAKPRAINVRIIGELEPLTRSLTQRRGRDSHENSTRITGRLRRFTPEKGFGFIACSDGRDVFVHANSFKDEEPEPCNGNPDSKPLGQEVEFALDFRNPDRPRAIHAKIIGDSLPSSDRYGDHYSKSYDWNSPSESRQPRYNQWNENHDFAQPGARRWETQVHSGEGSTSVARDVGKRESAAPSDTDCGELPKLLAEVMRHTDKFNLENVRNDGYALLSEVLACEIVAPVLEALAPGSLVALQSEQVTDDALNVVRAAVATKTADGKPMFDLWEQDDNDGWLKLEDESSQEDTAGQASWSNYHDSGNRGRDQSDSAEAKRAVFQAADHKSDKDGGQDHRAEDDGEDGKAWWQGGADDADGADAHKITDPFRGGANQSALIPVTTKPPSKAGGGGWMKQPKVPAGDDPWAGAADPWAGAADPWASPKKGREGVEEEKEEKHEEEEEEEGEEEADTQEPLASGGTGESEPTCAAPPGAGAEGETGGKLAAEDIMKLLAQLPADAPRGVRQYLQDWARNCSLTAP